MAGINGLFDLGLGALQAQQAGVSAAGRNTANINTPGYRLESADLRSVDSGGVVVKSFIRADDAILASRERTGESVRAHSEAIAKALENLEAGLSSLHEKLVSSMASMFGGFTELSAAPTDINLREQAIDRADIMAVSFHSASAAIVEARSGADRNIATLAVQATSLAKDIASANRAVKLDPSNPLLADQRDHAAEQLAGLVGGKARIDSDGMMRVVLENGASLVDGDHASEIRAVADPTLGGLSRVQVVDGPHTSDVTATLSGGQIGGLLRFRDGEAAQQAQQLDQLAFDLSTQMNAVHRTQAGLDGNSGRDLFVEPTSVQGAAAALEVDPQLLADHRLLASATPGSGPGDTGGLAALSALSTANVAGGGTRSFQEEAIRIGSQLGSSTKAAKEANALDETRSQGLRAIRDSLSGVSQEEELAKLSQFQRAHEATVRFIQTVDGLLDDLIQKV